MPESKLPEKMLVVTYMSPGVANDGGGIVIIGGKVVRVPPRSPAFKQFEASLQLLNQVDQIADKRAKAQIAALVEPIVKANAEAVAAEVSTK